MMITSKIVTLPWQQKTFGCLATFPLKTAGSFNVKGKIPLLIPGKFKGALEKINQPVFKVCCSKSVLTSLSRNYPCLFSIYYYLFGVFQP